jgi:3D (Asp-Asp-Asp) domain-containing protein
MAHMTEILQEQTAALESAPARADVVGVASREVVRERRSRLLFAVMVRRVFLFGTILTLTAGSAILAKEVRSAPALANIELIVTEPSEVVPESMEHAPDAADEGSRFDEVALVEVPNVAALIFEPTPTEDEKAMQAWGTLVRDPSVRWFDGRPIKPSYDITLKCTAYSPDERSCGTSADGITATLHSVETNGHCLVAADPKWFPAGTLLSVPGYDENRVVPVLDVGGAIKGRHIDLLFPTHEEARKWGVKKLKVTVWEYADGKPVVSPRKLR